MASTVFGNKRPIRQHLVRGRHGIRGEIVDLRKDIDEAFETLEAVGASKWIRDPSGFIHPKIITDNVTIGTKLLVSSTLTHTANESAYVISSNAGIGGALDNASSGRWRIETAGGIASFGSVVPAATGIRSNTTMRQVFALTGECAFKTGAVAADADPSALLRLISTVSGFGLPAMTKAQRDAIASPVTGLQVHNTTSKTTNYFDGTSWRATPPLSFAPTGVSSDTTTLGVADIYVATATGITFTISTADITDGRAFEFSDESGATSVGTPITIDMEGGETIDGANSVQITVPFGSIKLYARGGNLFSRA